MVWPGSSCYSRQLDWRPEMFGVSFGTPLQLSRLSSTKAGIAVNERRKTSYHDRVRGGAAPVWE